MLLAYSGPMSVTIRRGHVKISRSLPPPLRHDGKAMAASRATRESPVAAASGCRLGDVMPVDSLPRFASRR